MSVLLVRIDVRTHTYTRLILHEKGNIICTCVCTVCIVTCVRSCNAQVDLCARLCIARPRSACPLLAPRPEPWRGSCTWREALEPPTSWAASARSWIVWMMSPCVVMHDSNVPELPTSFRRLLRALHRERFNLALRHQSCGPCGRRWLRRLLLVIQLLAVTPQNRAKLLVVTTQNRACKVQFRSSLQLHWVHDTIATAHIYARLVHTRATPLTCVRLG